MPKQIERAHVMHYSSQYSDGDAKLRNDLDFVFDKDPDFISFTEFGSKAALNVLVGVCRRREYHLYRAEAGSGLNGDDCCIAVRSENRQIRFKEGGKVRVHPGQNKPENQGGRYGPKNITWLTARFFGVDVTHHVAHWVHNQTDDQRGINLERARATSQMMAEQVRKHGRRGAVSFFAGDMNVDPDQAIYPRHIFEENKLVTIWEDAGQRPTHGGRAIDVVGRYGADKRVTFVRSQVHPVQNSDHRPVSAFYDIRVDNAAPVDNPPNPGPDDEPPKFNAGNVSWADYTDNEIYDLPQATDDSDDFNG